MSGRPNKSQQKRETRALHALVKRLVALPPAQLAGLTLDESVMEAVAAARTMRRAALARQLRYLTGLMRAVDADVVVRELEALAGPHRGEVRAFQEAERWRDALIAGNDALVEELAARFSADGAYLRRLVRDARTERDRNAPPRSSRLLFRYLRELQAGE